MSKLGSCTRVAFNISVWCFQSTIAYLTVINHWIFRLAKHIQWLCTKLPSFIPLIASVMSKQLTRFYKVSIWVSNCRLFPVPKRRLQLYSRHWYCCIQMTADMDTGERYTACGCVSLVISVPKHIKCCMAQRQCNRKSKALRRISGWLFVDGFGGHDWYTDCLDRKRSKNNQSGIVYIWY